MFIFRRSVCTRTRHLRRGRAFAFLRLMLPVLAVLWTCRPDAARASNSCDFSFWRRFGEHAIYRKSDGKSYFFITDRLSDRVDDDAYTLPISVSVKADSQEISNLAYIVMPGGEFLKAKGTGAPGDVGMAWNLRTGSSVAFVVGGVADKDDKDALGKGSDALFKAIDIDADAKDEGGMDEVLFALFPGSRKDVPANAPQTQADVERRVNARAMSLLHDAKLCMR